MLRPTFAKNVFVSVCGAASTSSMSFFAAARNFSISSLWSLMARAILVYACDELHLVLSKPRVGPHLRGNRRVDFGTGELSGFATYQAQRPELLPADSIICSTSRSNAAQPSSVLSVAASIAC